MTLSQRQPLSLIWESFILRISQPIDGYDLRQTEAELFMGDPRRLALCERSLKPHPFNFSEEDVNIWRAQRLLSELFTITGSRSNDAAAQRWPAWCPRDAAGFVEAVKKERESMDTLGYLNLRREGPQDECKRSAWGRSSMR